MLGKSRRRMAVTGSRSAGIDPARGPVVVGGVGGSGTRVVADILRCFGVDTGSDLNKAGDNFWFTFLGKLPRWDLEAALAPDSPTMFSYGVLERAMTGQLRPTRAERRFIAAVVERCLEQSRQHPLADDRTPEWLGERAQHILESRRQGHPEALMWGWKEPNSHLFIEHLHRYFGARLRYIHVVRNGLHMATSKNQYQVRRWGPLFGVVVQSQWPSPRQSLDYWILSNEAAIRKGHELAPGRFLVVNYDELCADPAPGVDRLATFLGLDLPRPTLSEAASLPRPPTAPGASAVDAATAFSEEQFARVRAMGFPTARSE
jgi:Sulfotransferase family